MGRSSASKSGLGCCSIFMIIFWIIAITFIDLLQAVGKDRLSAANEVLHVALTARYYGRTARRYLRSERGEGILPLLTRVDRHYVPKGLVGVIGPWNYPLTMAISDGLAALVAGNAIMLKPDHQTPLVALAAVELLRNDRPARRPVAGGARTRNRGGTRVDRRQRLCVLHRIDCHGTYGRRAVRRAD